MRGEGALASGTRETHVRRSRVTGEAQCPVCARVSRDAASDPWRELADPAHRRTGAEAIVDHLGFCARHAVALGRDPWPAGLAAVAAEAFGMLAAMLDDRTRYEERLVHMMFHARQGCAACTVERRRAPIEPCELAVEAHGLCFPHYLAAAAKADERQLALLAAGALRSATAWRERLEADVAEDRAALAWLTGDTHGASVHSGLASEHEWQCPVCRAAARAQEKWLELVAQGAHLGAELRGLLPLCPLHVSMCLERVGAHAGREVARQATKVVAARLGRGLAENERAVQRDREQSTSVWYRRRAPSYVLGLRRRALRMPYCGACERVDLACQHAQGEVLDLVASRKGRDLLATRGELCLRHFGAVYMLCPHGEPRAALAARQHEALVRAQAALAAGAPRGGALNQLGAAGGG
ncbi:MAG: hypothetical protein ACM338_08960 [Betaproteobacteria bacterium]